MFDVQNECGLRIIKELVEGDKNISRIYGFILYTPQHPYVAKVLEDRFFWEALDSISGSKWPIFAVRPLQQGRMRVERGAPPGMMSMMIQTWDEPKENLSIIRDFGLEDSRDLPLFIAFMWDDNDDLHQISIHIHGSDKDTVYHSLEAIVREISQTEAKIQESYKRTPAVFREVSQQLEALKFKFRLVNRGKSLKKII